MEQDGRGVCIGDETDCVCERGRKAAGICEEMEGGDWPLKEFGSEGKAGQWRCGEGKEMAWGFGGG